MPRWQTILTLLGGLLGAFVYLLFLSSITAEFGRHWFNQYHALLLPIPCSWRQKDSPHGFQQIGQLQWLRLVREQKKGASGVPGTSWQTEWPGARQPSRRLASETPRASVFLVKHAVRQFATLLVVRVARLNHTVTYEWTVRILGN